MSVGLFKSFLITLRTKLPRHSFKTDLQFRFTATMNIASDDTTKIEEENLDKIMNKKLTRFRRRFMKRQWEETINNKTEETLNDGESNEKKVCERLKRKKMALLLGYCGVDYYGMQRNPGVKTIEEDLFKALLDAKYITKDDYENQQNAQFQRSSRTDKGVSAARQIVSLKLPLEVDIQEINKRLPECIRIFGMKRVTNKFNSKGKCNARTYSYTLPTYVFEPSVVTIEERNNYRIPDEKLEKVKSVLNNYKGTKTYHNFTEKKHFNDPSSIRYMMSFTVEIVFVESDMEFAVLLVKGQSFMLHQIRKMVGLMIAMVRGHAEESVMERVFGKEKVMIPTAPGLGLVLDMVHYDRYDAKFKVSHESLTWEAEEEAVQKFKHQYIYPNIVKGETQDNSMGIWLEKLQLHGYEPSDDAGEKVTQEGEKEIDDDDDDDDDDKDEEKDEVQKEIVSDGAKLDNDKDGAMVEKGEVLVQKEIVSDNIVVDNEKDKAIVANEKDKAENKYAV